MRFVVLSLVFCTAVRAAPVASSDVSGAVVAGRDGVAIFECNTEVLAGIDREKETKARERRPNERHTIRTGGDPALNQIFKDVENIIESDRLPIERKWNHIVDAIVHNEESKRENHHNHSENSDELLLAVFDILDDDTYSKEEKIGRIFEKIDLQSKSNMSFEPQNNDNRDEAVLDSIESILHGPQSAQKRIQKILNQLANYLHPTKSESNYATAPEGSQEILTIVK